MGFCCLFHSLIVLLFLLVRKSCKEALHILRMLPAHFHTLNMMYHVHTLSMEASAKEARFEITEEFARDAYRGLEDFKDSVEPSLEDLKVKVAQLQDRVDGLGATAAVAGGAAVAAGLAAMSSDVVTERRAVPGPGAGLTPEGLVGERRVWAAWGLRGRSGVCVCVWNEIGAGDARDWKREARSGVLVCFLCPNALRQSGGVQGPSECPFTHPIRPHFAGSSSTPSDSDLTRLVQSQLRTSVALERRLSSIEQLLGEEEQG